MPVIPLHGTPTYQGEVLLLGWSENNRDGMTVRLALDASDEGAAHPFRSLGTGKHGQRFMAVLVPLGDDEQPVIAPIPPAQEPAPIAPAAPVKERTPWDALKKAQQAAIVCNEPEFWQWLHSQCPSARAVDANEAAEYVRFRCEVLSRKDLDADESAGQRWNELHGEFKRWRADMVGQQQAEAQAQAYRR
jgi:hypothetical protein